MKVGDRVTVDLSTAGLWYPLEGGSSWKPSQSGTITHIGEQPPEGEWPTEREVEVTMDDPSPYGGPFYFYAYGLGSLTPEVSA